MKQRFRHVIDKLYKPDSEGARQVFAMSRTDAEMLPLLPSIAVISITAPERRPAKLEGFAYLLRLSFADVDFLNTSLSKKAQEQVPDAFTQEQAQVIRSFVESLPVEVTSVVAHCEGGYSRSCAIALALHRIYGYLAELDHLSQANPSVVRRMMSVYRDGTT